MRFLALLGITEVSLLECVSLWSPQSDVVLTLNAYLSVGGFTRMALAA